MSATPLPWRFSLSSLSTPPFALPILRTSNNVSRNILTVSSLGISNHRTKQIGITKCAAAMSKRVSPQIQKGVWEEPDVGSEEEDEEKDWEYETESAGCGGVAAAEEYAERLRGEVEELLTQEERSILEQNEAPDVSKISTMKWGLFHTLALSGQIPFMDKLLEQGADIDSRDQDGFTALHKAVIGKKETVICHLLRKGANPNVKDKDGATPLHYAVQVGAFQTVKLLIKYQEGWTPLHLSIQSRCRDIAKVLLVNGADKTRRNKDGKTALDLSLCYGKDFKSYDLAKLVKLVPADSIY
ncbi:hypothetical protein Scep_021500 [Stephania cephalantha]|uniref:Ankyrin repeat domain-containing protein EMB506, chloroplastic n=1 Tax=Stephania cephalantha TaxID=152367 RepID=A0AAP0I1G5_9MAGN